MEPIKKPSAESVKILFDTCHKILSETNFEVHSLTMDNHRVNQSFIQQTSGEDLFSLTIPHNVFVFYDPVHISKNMYYMLINKGIIKLPWLPSLDGDGRYKGVVNANMAHLRLLLAKDQGQLRIGHKLTQKVVN